MFCEGSWAGLTHDPSLRWQTFQSGHFRVHYHDGLETQARRTLAIAETVHARLVPFLAWAPRELTDIVLTDETDLPNGFSQPFPKNRIVLYLTPLDEGLFDYGPWLSTLITHEYVHTLHLDMSSRWPFRLRNVFGRNPLLFPGLYQPLWFIEGLATYIETEQAGGIGRGQSSYFQMLMRAELAAGLKPISQINQPIRTWPSGAAPYLYGYYFYEFIAQRYGESKIQELLRNYRRNLIPFRINSNANAVLGAKLKPLWREFETYLQEKFKPQLQLIEARGVREGVRLTDHGYNTGRAKVLPDGTLYYLRADGASETTLMRRDADGKIHALAPLHGDARFDVHPQHGIVVAQVERYNNARLHFDLYRIDPITGESTRLTFAKRYRFVVWLADGSGFLAVRYHRGNMALVQLDINGELLSTLWEGHDGEIVSTPDVSPDGAQVVASMWSADKGWHLALFDLLSRKWRALPGDSAIELQPRFTPSGESIVFSADYEGIYSIYELSLSTDAIRTLTNVQTGAFSPSLDSQGTLYYMGYHSDGFDVYVVNQPDHSVAQIALNGGSSYTAHQAPQLNDLSPASEYTAMGKLAPVYWTPLIAADADRFTLGAATTAYDPLERHAYGAVGAYDVEQDEWIAGLDYLYDGGRTLFEIHAVRDFSLARSNGDLIAVRERYFLNAALSWPFSFYRHQWLPQIGIATEFERDRSVAPGFTSIPDSKDYLAGVALTFDSTRRFPLSISRSDGRRVTVVAEDSDFLNGNFGGQIYTLDWRELIDLPREHVIALRLVRGWGTKSPRRFQLGGSGSSSVGNLLDVAGAGIALNERDYPLRGYPDGLAQLRGRRMQSASAEWRFPLARIERGFMAPPMAVDQLAGTLFIDAGATWENGDSPAKYYDSFGAELHADLRFFYHVPIHARLGFANGREGPGEKQVYLQLGGSF